MASRDLYINLRPSSQQGAFVQSSKNLTAYTFSKFYREEAVAFRVFFLNLTPSAGISSPAEINGDLSSYSCKIAIGDIGGTVLAYEGLTWDSEESCFTGTLLINTTEMNTALDASSSGEITKTLEVELAYGGTEFTFQSPVTVRNEVIVNGGALPTDVTDTVFADYLTDALVDSPEVDYVRDGDDVESHIAVWRDATLSGQLRLECPPSSAHSTDALNDTGSISVTVNGFNDRLYQLDLRVRGLCVLMNYTGGSQLGYVYLGGTYNHNTSDPWWIEISDPPQTVRLNATAGIPFNRIALDYLLSVTAKGGATITLHYDTQDGAISPYVSPIYVPGVAPYPDEFDGHFIELTLVNKNSDGMILSDLDDGPDDLLGNALKVLRVKSDESGTEWAEMTNDSSVRASCTTTNNTPTALAVTSGSLTLGNDEARAFSILAKAFKAGVSGVTWTARDSARLWREVAASSDGTKLVACVSGGQIYTSTDSGASWTARDSARNWSAVASSSDGTKLVAVVYGDQIYTSTDSGASWTARDSARNWSAVASSSDGTKLVAVANGDQIYTSTDSGATWTARESSRSWVAVASSSDGVKLLASTATGHLYTSTDSGATWTARESSRSWGAVASSADGTKLYAMLAGGGGQIYTSTDSGINWTARSITGQWADIACSADGLKLLGADQNGYLYTSRDAGVTWVQRESSRYWRGVAMASDASLLIATGSGTNIYTSGSEASEVDQWQFAGIITRDANAASTAAKVVPGAYTGLTTWTFAVAENTTTGALELTFTGENGKTIAVAAEIIWL